MATKLEKLQVGEVSGVDDPANLTPGWMVAKSKSVEEVLEQVEEAHESLLTAIDSADVLLQDAPADVQAAAAVLKTHLTDDDSTKRNLIGRALRYFKRKEDIEMTKDELLEALTERDTTLADAISKAVAEAVSTAVEKNEAPVEETTETVTEETVEVAEAVPAVSVEDFAKLSERVEAVAEAIAKVADATHALIEKSARRTSLEGQEDGDAGKSENQPSALNKAFQAAVKHGRVDLR